MYYFVSGGPGGSEEYLTLKGYRILKKADVVFYHTLFPMLYTEKVCRKSCKLISVRDKKVAERIEMVKNKPNLSYVELLSGDFAFFSTAQGVIDELNIHQLKFEIVPGVSSISMAASLLKNELLLPMVSQSLIVTYLESRSMIDTQSIEKLASHNATMVVMMGKEENLGRLKSQLLKGGVSPDTPVAVVLSATYPNQTILHITVDEIDKIQGDIWHTIIIIGWVLADKAKRHEISGLPFTVGFSKAEDFMSNK